MSHSVLIVEDDIDQQQYLRTNCLEEGYHVLIASDGMTALKIVEKSTPDIVLLDVRLPDINGETLFVTIRKQCPDMPVIFLTAQDTSPHIVHAFDMGADDYISKPYVVEEVLARVRARLRKDNKVSMSVLEVADITLNKKTYEVKRNNKLITLTPKEFKLLEYFMTNVNQVLSRDQILNIVWQYHYDIESRVVDMYVGMLRKKIDNGFQKKLIHSVRGFGYLFKD